MSDKKIVFDPDKDDVLDGIIASGKILASAAAKKITEKIAETIVESTILIDPCPFPLKNKDNDKD